MIISRKNCADAPGHSAVWLLLLAALLACWPLLTGCDSGPKTLTAAQVEDFLKQLDAAALKKDPSVLLEHLAKDATITVKMNTPVGPQTTHYTAKEYREKVYEELKAVIDFKYQRLDTKIEISTDQKSARVTLKLQEFLTLKTSVLGVQSQQVSIYNLKRGKIVIKSVESEGFLKRVK